MFRHELVIQGPDNQDAVLRAVAATARTDSFTRLRGAYAFASRGGALVLTQTLGASLSSWHAVRKRWLISFDFGHTQPEALAMLMRLSQSRVRIPDANHLLRRNLVPRICFHPKTLILDQGRNQPPAGLIVGSANMTVSGLQAAHEHATAAIWTGDQTGKSSLLLRRMRAEARRFDVAWRTADPLDVQLLDRYREVRERVDRSRPFGDEDETDAVEKRSKATATKSFEKAAAMAKADCFWIETPYVVKNRGPNRPGNQIDLAKGSRVFFGGTARDVPRNTPLASILIRYGSNDPVDRHMRYGNNHMDKLDLPIPERDGPPTYEGETLLFRKQRNGIFRLRLGGADQVRDWKRRAQEQGTLYRMRPGQAAAGREYGVFVE